MASINITIPKELEDYKPEMRRFFDAMAYKLFKNAHKGKWEGMDINNLIQKLRDEVDELDTAVINDDMFDIVFEAADVANFAMMVSAVAISSMAGER